VYGVLSVVEQQPYKVISDINGIQIRDYPASVYAQVSLNDNPDRVGRKAFTPLIRYVSSNSIPMTAPVVQEADGEGWNFSFVMPAGSKASDLTQPSDSQVTIRVAPAHRAAATTWSGFWKYSEVKKRCDAMLEQLAEIGYEAVDEPRWARYDPPWKPWFMRRQEVIIPVLKL